MENVGESSKQKKPRLNWKKESVVKTFLEACIHEVAVNGRDGVSLKMLSWKNVGEILKKEHNFIADQRQMKNHFDYLKSKFSAWTKLKNKTGNVYDPVTNTFNLTEEEWQIEMKVTFYPLYIFTNSFLNSFISILISSFKQSNKYVEPVRSTGLLFPDLCTQLFDGSTSNGFEGWGPASNLPNDCEDSANVVSVEDDDIQHVQAIPTTTQEPPNSTKECSIAPQDKKRKGKQASSSNKSAVEEDFAKVVQLMMEKHRGDDIDACMEKLEKVGWGTQNMLYDVAVMLFSESADYRKVWMRLKPESLENWVRNAGRKYGILD